MDASALITLFIALIRRLFLHLISIQSILKRLEDKFVIGLIVYIEGYLSDKIVAANQMLIAIREFSDAE